MSRKWQFLMGILLTVMLVVGVGFASSALAASKTADYKFKWRMPQTMPVGDDHDLRAVAPRAARVRDRGVARNADLIKTIF